jgi:tRNA threonylcarbamoyladenosine biosynthesis protein TsaB
MRILALETSDQTGSVAALDGDNLLEELILEQSQRSAQSLAPAMQNLLRRVGWQPSDVQLVAVSVGPGSFTGLRVGVTAAKVFAYAVGAEVLGINTLEVIVAGTLRVPSAEAAESGCECLAAVGTTARPPSQAAVPAAAKPPPAPVLQVIIDAQRGDVVVQSFVLQPDGWFAEAAPMQLLSADAWLSQLRAGAIVTGPGLERLHDRLPLGVEAPDWRLWHPRAAVVGRLAARHYALGRRDDLWKLVPHYYRPSAAEEKWNAQAART